MLRINRCIWVLLAAPLLAQLATAATCSVQSGAKVQPLVELYTSEGCSSCPPADAWFSQAQRDRSSNWIAFHVDYWDALGWPDRFADARYSERQRDRVSAVGDRTVYTPQVMIAADTKVRWHQAAGVSRALETQRAQTAPVRIQMSYDVAKGEVAITAQLLAGAKLDTPVLWLAELESGLSTQVRAGENARRQLRHDAVVRSLHGPYGVPPDQAGRSKRITLRATEPGKSVHAVAWVEDARRVPAQSLALQGGTCR